MLIPNYKKVFISHNKIYSKKDVFRFLSLIKIKKYCWEWIGVLISIGYGRFMLYKNGKKIPRYAHRVSYELFTNKQIPNNIYICHKCDNRKCVNPNHLFPGTNQDNMNDMVKKNRQASGEKQWNSKLTKKQVTEIRLLYNTGEYTKQELSTMFPVNRSAISKIIRNKTWKQQ